LADSPDSFARTLAEEMSRTNEQWADLHAQSIASPSRFSAVAERETRPVGIAYGQLAIEAPDVAHLYSMWVEPSARRSNVGRALVEAVVCWAQSQRARRLVLRVTESNVPALRLYERMGFAATGEVSPLRDGCPLLVRTMIRVL
jgi:ribosomal protein S18 acetylase RimI-like enzyme